MQHLVRLEVREENEPAEKPPDNNINDDNTINVNAERELRKSRRDVAMNANLIRRLRLRRRLGLNSLKLSWGECQ